MPSLHVCLFGIGMENFVKYERRSSILLPLIHSLGSVSPSTSPSSASPSRTIFGSQHSWSLTLSLIDLCLYTLIDCCLKHFTHSSHPNGLTQWTHPDDIPHLGSIEQKIRCIIVNNNSSLNVSWLTFLADVFVARICTLIPMAVMLDVHCAT